MLWDWGYCGHDRHSSLRNLESFGARRRQDGRVWGSDWDRMEIHRPRELRVRDQGRHQREEVPRQYLSLSRAQRMATQLEKSLDIDAQAPKLKEYTIQTTQCHRKQYSTMSP